jgi:hypothetical protein
MLHEVRYVTGAILETTDKTTFLIATLEKALVDKIWTVSSSPVALLICGHTSSLQRSLHALLRFEWIFREI